jgi:hypothetical protein
MKHPSWMLSLCTGLILLHPAIVSAKPDISSFPVLHVSVYNDASISSASLDQAELYASRIFLQAGVQVVWLRCPQAEFSVGCSEAVYPTHLHVRILNASRSLNSSAVGLSFLSADGEGCYADLFYAPVADLHNTTGIPSHVILGHALAHELGHLLLGTNSHSSKGLMRARWDIRNLEDAERGKLVFSAAQSLRITSRLAQYRIEWLTSGELAH